MKLFLIFALLNLSGCAAGMQSVGMILKGGGDGLANASRTPIHQQPPTQCFTSYGGGSALTTCN